MTIGAAFLEGHRRVVAAPAVLLGVFVLTFLMALPLALAVRAEIAGHLGSSLEAETAATGVNYDWWQEFASQASEIGAGIGAGIGATFSPTIIGFASTLDNLSDLLDARYDIAPIAAAAAVYLLAWIFLTGGILDRYARQRPTRAYGFFGAAGGFFWRLLRLGATAGAVYWFLFAYVHPWLLDDAYTRLTRDLSVEREAFAWRVALYAAFGVLLLGANTVFDYAKIRLVVEDRRSAMGALRAGIRFIWRRTAQVAGLYALNALLFVGLLAVWAVAAPGAGGAGWSLWLGFAAAQLYLLARLLLKLQFMASQTALFQASLAHAGYTAAPPRAWPESAAAETIR